MAEDITVTLQKLLSTPYLEAGTNLNTLYSGQTGYLTPNQMMYTPQGTQWVNDLYNRYNTGYLANEAGYGLPGRTGGDPNQLRSTIMSTIQNPENDPQLYNWIMGQGGMPQVPTMARDQMKMADTLARDLANITDGTQRWLQDQQASLARDLQSGLLSHQQAMQAAQLAHDEAMQRDMLAFKYAELAWTQEYGRENLGILRERLGVDKRLAAVQERLASVEENRFGLEKNIQEAQLRANPFNAVANTLYTRGASVPAGQTEFGQPTTTLDNSGQLPFLQQLAGGGIDNPIQGGMFMNEGGIGGNVAPNPNQISQKSFGNMSDTERGVNTSLAQYGGWNPSDYWRRMTDSWNTAGQGGMNFGGTRLL